jgi:hypothetical protein
MRRNARPRSTIGLAIIIVFAALVSSTIDRLFLQRWPSAIFAAFLAARTPEQLLSRAALAGGAAP